MREQLTLTLERNVDPAPWRERARERVAAFEREAARKRPVAAPKIRPVRLPWMIALGGAFVLGVVTAFAVAFFLVVRPQPQPPASDLAGIIIETPAVAADTPPAPRLAPASVRQAELEPATTSVVSVAASEPPPVELRPASEPRVERAVETVSAEPVVAPAVAEVEPVRPEPAVSEPAPEPAPVRVETAASPVAPLTGGNSVERRVAMIRESQTLLAALGYVPGRADGDPGPQTISAAALFATERGLADSNFDMAFLAALREARAGALPVRPTDDREETVVERVARIRETQALLLAQGFELGRADGDAGPATLDAAATFAENAGLADTNVDAAFLAALRAASVGGLQQ